MEGRFDIFRIDADGEAMWVEDVTDRPTATAHVRAMGQWSPGRYVILDQIARDATCLEVSHCGFITVASGKIPQHEFVHCPH